MIYELAIPKFINIIIHPTSGRSGHDSRACASPPLWIHFSFHLVSISPAPPCASPHQKPQFPHIFSTIATFFFNFFFYTQNLKPIIKGSKRILSSCVGLTKPNQKEILATEKERAQQVAHGW